MRVIEIFILFLIGCLAGWTMEAVCGNFFERKRINPGFLKGPYLPIYGFSIIMLYLVSELKAPLTYKIILLIILPTAMELITGTIFKKYFKIKLWDYSNKTLNWDGIICLEFFIYWGILSLAYYFFFHNILNNYLLQILSNTNYNFIYWGIAGIFLIDTVYAFGIAFRIRKKVNKIKGKSLSFKKFKKVSGIFRHIKNKVEKMTKNHNGKD